MRCGDSTTTLTILPMDFTGEFTMCDVNVFILKNGVEEKVLENVDVIEAVDGGMHIVNIFGEERTINAIMVHYNNSEKRMLFQPV